ncbi:hypothetical protein RPALISO_160 [Ruegeria phage RpAliso]|nr:hypothetical protein RPALISO_160 [Ruegeria phage RpAliso]
MPLMRIPSLENYSVYTTAEELPENLRDHVFEIEGTGMEVFQHRATVQLMPLCLPLPVEEYIARWQEHVDALLTQGRLQEYIYQHERAFRMERLVELTREMAFPTMRDQVKFWNTARWTWTDSEMDESDPLWRDLLECGVPNRRAMMSHSDRAFVDALGEPLEVYRGGPVNVVDDPQEALSGGFSWTLDRKVAEKFARRYMRKGQRPVVLTHLIAKSDIILYTNDRNEEEVLVDPDHVEWGWVQAEILS